ncbi:MAG TPA: hypothetical protein VF088_01910 [Pyrinomonadaceae bacterium]
MKRYTTLLFGVVLAVSLGMLTLCRTSGVKAAGAPVVDQWISTTPFNNPRVAHRSVRYGNHLYVMGGYYFDFNVGLVLYNDVQYASLANDGSIVGGWNYTTPFQTPRLGHAAALNNGYVYIIAGGDGFSFFNDVQYAKLNSDGTVASDGWHTTSSLNVPRSNAEAVVRKVGNTTYLYVVGGVGQVGDNFPHFNTTEYAVINADGSLGPFTLSPSTFNKGRSALGTLIVDGNLYVIGGWGDDFLADIFDDVQFAHLNNDGSIGPWTTSQNKIHTRRYGHTAVLSPQDDQTMVILGGNHGEGQYLNDVQFATVGPTGETSPWTQLSADNNFPNPRWGHTSVTYKSFVYVIGGSIPGGFLNDVQYRRLDVP